MTKFNQSWSLTIIFNCYFFLMLLAYFQESHIDKRFKQNLTFHFINSDGQFNSNSILADNFDYLCFIFKLFAFVFDLGCGTQARSDFWLHAIDDFEVWVLRFLKSDSFGAVCEISDLYSDLIILVDFNVFENNFGWYYFKTLRVNRLLFNGRSIFDRRRPDF